jgi:GT2 family glycosyltransferase
VTLSVVIVNWNTRDMLLGAVRSIEDQPQETDLEIIVVDNASPDGSADALARSFPAVRLIRNATNDGYARGNNQGIAAASGRYVLLLNPDVIVPSGALDRAVAHMAARPDVGALGARLVGTDGNVQRSVRGFPTPLSVACEALGLSRAFPRSRRLASYRMGWFDYDRESEVDQPMGTFLLIRREALDRVGVLDERFPIFFNEVDWCFRAKRAGFHILFVPDVTITHYGGAGTGQVAARMAWESRSGLLTYFRKHYGGARHWPVYALAATTSWVHAWIVSRRRARAAASA